MRVEEENKRFNSRESNYTQKELQEIRKNEGKKKYEMVKRVLEKQKNNFYDEIIKPLEQQMEELKKTSIKRFIKNLRGEERLRIASTTLKWTNWDESDDEYDEEDNRSNLNNIKMS